MQEECYRLILAKGGNHDLQDINGCTVTHILTIYNNMRVTSKIREGVKYYFIDCFLYGGYAAKFLPKKVTLSSPNHVQFANSADV